jgi:predicted RNase H-like nuclease (RuvC/YqgF family)
MGSSSDILETSPRQSAQSKEKEKVVSPDDSVKRRSHQPAEHHKADNNGSDYAFVMSAMLSEIKKLQQSVQDLSESCQRQEKRTEDLNAQLEKINKAHYDLRREQTDNLSDVLEKICKLFWWSGDFDKVSLLELISLWNSGTYNTIFSK